MFDKLDGMVKHLKEHDSILLQPNGLTLKQGEEFAHDFNVEQIKCIEAKLLKVKQDMEMLEENKKSFHTIYKGIHTEHISKRRRKKEVVYRESDKYHLVLSRLFSYFNPPTIINKLLCSLVYYVGSFKIRK